jgi:hypothetical protein
MIDYSKITPQDIVDMVWARLNDGAGRAINKWGDCAYKDDNGNKCAVGIFLPENHPIQEVGGDIDKLFMVASAMGYDIDGEDWLSFLEENYDILNRLQKIHDDQEHWYGNDFNALGYNEFSKFCVDNKLKFPESKNERRYQKYLG